METARWGDKIQLEWKIFKLYINSSIHKQGRLSNYISNNLNTKFKELKKQDYINCETSNIDLVNTKPM